MTPLETFLPTFLHPLALGHISFYFCNLSRTKPSALKSFDLKSWLIRRSHRFQLRLGQSEPCRSWLVVQHVIILLPQLRGQISGEIQDAFKLNSDVLAWYSSTPSWGSTLGPLSLPHVSWCILLSEKGLNLSSPTNCRVLAPRLAQGWSRTAVRRRELSASAKSKSPPLEIKNSWMPNVIHLDFIFFSRTILSLSCAFVRNTLISTVCVLDRIIPGFHSFGTLAPCFGN